MANETFTVELTGTLTREQLEEMALRQAAGETPQVAEEAETKYATVTVIRQGKAGARTLRVEEGSTGLDVMSELNWQHSAHTFQLTSGDSPAVASFSKPEDIVFSEGNHTLVVQPRVSGGL